MRRTLTLLGTLTSVASLRPQPLLTRPPIMATTRCFAAVLMLDADLTALTVVQLKDKLRAAGLPVSGRKAELITRLGGSTNVVSALVSVIPPIVQSAALVQIEACKS